MSDLQRLPWVIRHEGRSVARFASERDAKGFARARYPDAEVRRARLTQRLEILDWVRAGARTSAEVSAAAGLPLNHVAAHLSALARQGLVVVERCGPGRRARYLVRS